MCRVPWCKSRRNVTCHHILARARGGKDEIENGLTLCAGCHRLVEENKLEITRRDGCLIISELGTAGEAAGVPKKKRPIKAILA